MKEKAAVTARNYKKMSQNAYCLITFILLFIVSSCGNNHVKIDENLSREEAEIVIKTEKSLPRGSKILSYQVVNNTLPLALLDSEYKSFRDKANKARIDFRTNSARGLTSAAQNNLTTLKNIQSDIVKRDSDLMAQSPEYFFVLAEISERQRKDGNNTGIIAIFDPDNLEQVDLLQVTQPLYNNAVMVTEALNGTLANPTPENIENLKSNNPIVNFILRSHPK